MPAVDTQAVSTYFLETAFDSNLDRHDPQGSCSTMIGTSQLVMGIRVAIIIVPVWRA
jgi:hypothetical protein